jgi:protein-S-isoprenylcysteine O-methyltransferase Ste14
VPEGNHGVRGLKDLMFKKLSPLVYLLMSILLTGALHLLLPMRELIPFPWRLTGVPLLLLGIVLNILADQSLKRHVATVRPFAVSSALVTEGIYRVSRHPMYLGMILIMVAIAVLLGSLAAWLILPLFAILLDARFIRTEESVLEETFGETYRKYRKQTRRWI